MTNSDESGIINSGGDELRRNEEKYSKVFEDAKNGGKHAGTYRQAMEKTDAQLDKSIKRHEEKKAEHQEKVNNPKAYYSDWDIVSKNVQNGRLEKWEKEIMSFQDQAEIEKRVREVRKNERNN